MGIAPNITCVCTACENVINFGRWGQLSECRNLKGYEYFFEDA